MSELTLSQPTLLPEPTTPMAVRVATRADMPFMDRLQKLNSKALGFFPRAQMEGYVDAGNVLVAVGSACGPGLRDGPQADPTRAPLGYVISRDRYLKRDELGAVFQLCVAPSHQRGFIGANLLRAVFERASYGCRLFCCWCAQDLPANRFWEAMGFVPLAFRAGGNARSQRSGVRGQKGPRVHIYWQKRIRAGDTTTPYWFPAKTEGGAIREDRIILPIPLAIGNRGTGMKWWDEFPILQCGNPTTEKAERKWLSGPSARMPGTIIQPLTPTHRPCSGVQFGRIGAKPRTVLEGTPQRAIPDVKEARPKREKAKANPVLIAKARELRDRWLDHVAANGIESAGGGQIADGRKYDVTRSINARRMAENEPKRLAA